jgi:tRNA (adenine37-N6)-methyltransferase
MTLEPIGIFQAESKYPYEARRQAAADTSNSRGEIHLRPGANFEQALEDLEGFERIWIIYQFHHNTDWKPKVMPPRGPRLKRGVFATRAPYRPNPVGLSCVKLVKVEGLRVIVEGHDLLDGTPVMDIKPYIPYADAFPNARVGWLENVESDRWQVNFTNEANDQIHWLLEKGVNQLRGFIQAQLEFNPLDHKRKRLEKQGEDQTTYQLSYRTWRIKFKADEETRVIKVEKIQSGYESKDLLNADDPHKDKALHRNFQNQN